MTGTSRLYEPVKPEMATVESLLRSLSKVEPPWLGEMLEAVLSRGKRMRPAIALLSGKFGEFQSELLVPLAASLELLHTASLVHDDVIDSAGTRRGRPTAGSLFDNHAAIILGDYIFAQAAGLVARTGSTEVTRLFAETMVVMATAELIEDRGAFNYNQTTDDYLHRIKGKTAALFEIAAYGGALVSRADPRFAAALRIYGDNVGMAFQIVDDILDFTGDAQEMGKPVGSDLMQGTLTLPSLMLIERYPKDNPVKRLFDARGGAEHVTRAVEMVRESDILDLSYRSARAYHDRAFETLETLPNGPARDSLAALAEYVLERRI
jgi:octaprenyl-diphosphate synthase